MPGLEAIMPPAEAVSYLVNLAVAVSLVCGVGLLAARVRRHSSAPLRHGVLLWTLVLILLSPAAVWLAQQNGLALVRVTISGPPDTHGVLIADETALGVSGRPSVKQPRLAAASQPEMFASEASPVSADSSEGSLSAVGCAAVSFREKSPAPAWWQVMGSVAALLWATGAAVGLLRLGWGYMALARFCRRLNPLLDPRQKLLAHQAADAVGLRKLPPAFLSRSAGVPVSIGLLRPAIVLPEAMLRDAGEDQLQAVLLHEMAHIARHDPWVGVGQRIAAVLFWWNPLVHWACDEISDLREEICDNHVVLVQGEGQPLARILVDLAARVTIGPLLPSTAGVLEPRLAGLTGRVTRLLGKERNMETRMNLKTKVLVFACGLAVLIGMATVGSLRLAYARAAKEAQPAAAAPSASDVPKTAAGHSGDLRKPVQGAKPNHVTTYHAKLSPSWGGMSEVWVQLNQDGTPLRTRIDYPETEDGAKVVICSKGKAAVWFKDKKGYNVFPEKNALDRVVAMRKVCDPRLAFELLQARKEAGKVTIETTAPSKEGEFVRLTATSTDTPDQREVYEINPQTKLAERVTYYGRQGDRWKEVKLIEYLDDNKPIDPKVFNLDLPDDVTKGDQTKRPPGLLMGHLTKDQIATKVAREFFEALIAKDYEKAGVIYEGIPAAKMKAGFGTLHISRIVEIGKPVAGMHPDPTALAVSVKVECGVRKWVQEFSPEVRLTDNETATKAVRKFFEALIAGDDVAARRILDAGLVFEGFDAKNADKVKEFFEHYKVLRIVEVGKPAPSPETKRLEVPVKAEVEMKGERTREFRPYIRPVYNQPDRWTICGGI
jgi:beta-lactamase regulating signal transducer with metallopeptidase domain